MRFRIFRFPILILFVCFSPISAQQAEPANLENQFLNALHSISSHTLYDYVEELASEKYDGRLTGTPGYNASAEWMAGLFREWGVEPMGGDGYFQWFDIPYTLVFEDCSVSLHLPVKKETVLKPYAYESEFIPGSTSASGEITAEVVYVGYGITAPELDYDEYANVDVTDKIILVEREAPVSPSDDPEMFKRWRPYSFHQYKLRNAVMHGARGMLYNYGPIGNPNNAYDPKMIYSHVGDVVVKDLFIGTGKSHEATVDRIKDRLKPQSFRMRKTVTIRNTTAHHPEGRGANVIGVIPGDDPLLRDEVLILGGHLDHLGRCWEMMPGANDNASAVAVMLGVAKALTEFDIPLKRSVMFIGFGAEEQAVVGSKVYLENPVIPLEKTIGLLNMDGVGCGDKIWGLAGKNYPEFWSFIDKANGQYVHRVMKPTAFHNLARPRLDAARFMWAGVPTISFSVSGAPSYYHKTTDDVDTITPEILEDLAQILLTAVVEIANTEDPDFRPIP